MTMWRITIAVLVVLVVLGLTTGCGTTRLAQAPPVAPAAAPDLAAPPTVRGLPGPELGGGSARDVWTIVRFSQGDAWLAAYPELQTQGEPCAEQFADTLAAALRTADRRVYILKQPLTPAQQNQLVSQGLRYTCEGTLQLLDQVERDEAGATYRYGRLAAIYRLAVPQAGTARLLQTQRIVVETRIADHVQPRHLHQLIDQLAQAIARQLERDVSTGAM